MPAARRNASLALAAGLLAAGLLAAGTVSAQPKTIRIVVSFTAGGPVDTVARIVAEPLGRELGRPVLVDNKPGANAALGALEVLRADPDGGTLWLTSVGAAAINPALYAKLPYDMARDFAPVSLVVGNEELLVAHPSDLAADAAGFVANARRQSRPVAMASSGVGSIPHLAIEQLHEATGVAFLHVPYKGASQAVADLMGGEVAGFFGDLPGLLGPVRAGKLKALGLAAAHRHPALPAIATLEEQGIHGVDTRNWYAVFVAARTPAGTVDSLARALRAVLESPAVRERLQQAGADPSPSTPEALAALLRRDGEKWARLIQAHQIRPE